jgi:hypothetical protein
VSQDGKNCIHGRPRPVSICEYRVASVPEAPR